jgi:hypothetical protein
MQIDRVYGTPILNSVLYKTMVGGFQEATDRPQIVADNTGGAGLTSYNYYIACKQYGNTLPTYTKSTGIFKANPAIPGIQWSNYYVGAPNVDHIILTDMIQLSNNNLTLFGRSNIGSLHHPFTLDLSPFGSVLSHTSYNDSSNVMFASSITESCLGVVHNGLLLNGFHIKVAQVESSFPANQHPCTINFPMDSITTNIIETHVSVDVVELGKAYDYNINVKEIDHKIIDCLGEQLNYRPANTNDGTTDINDLMNTNSTNWIFPNPASSQLQVVLTDEQETVTIYNNLGQMVFTKKESGSISLNVSEFSNGVYLIERINNSGKVLRKKIIID